MSLWNYHILPRPLLLMNKRSTLRWHSIWHITKNSAWSHVWGPFPSAQLAAMWEEWMIGEWTRWNKEGYCLLYGLSRPDSILTNLSCGLRPWFWICCDPESSCNKNHEHRACAGCVGAPAAVLTHLTLFSPFSRPSTFQLHFWGDTGDGKASPFLRLFGLWFQIPQSDVFKR